MKCRWGKIRGRAGRISACHVWEKLRSTVGAAIASNPDKQLDAFADAGNPKAKLGALFDQREQLVEIRAGMEAGEGDAHGMKQLLALDAGCPFDLVHPRLEDLGSHRAVVGADVATELAEHSTRGVGSQNCGVLLICPCG